MFRRIGVVPRWLRCLSLFGSTHLLVWCLIFSLQASPASVFFKSSPVPWLKFSIFVGGIVGGVSLLWLNARTSRSVAITNEIIVFEMKWYRYEIETAALKVPFRTKWKEREERIQREFISSFPSSLWISTTETERYRSIGVTKVIVIIEFWKFWKFKNIYEDLFVI